MAHSLSEECTPLKREYDACFNAWFEGFLEPAVAATPEQRSKYSQEKAEEYERNCGKIWTQYRECVQVITLHSLPSSSFRYHRSSAGFLRLLLVLLLALTHAVRPHLESSQGQGS